MPAAAYVDSGEAQAILSGLHIFAGSNTVLSTNLLQLASDRLDSLNGPFIGGKYADGQVRAFPRSKTLGGDDAGAVPWRIKAWVALEAYRLSADEDPPISNFGLAGTGSMTFASPKFTREQRLQMDLIAPYQHKTALISAL